MDYNITSKLFLKVSAESEDDAWEKVQAWLDNIHLPEEIEIEDSETEVDPAQRFFSGNGQTGKII